MTLYQILEAVKLTSQVQITSVANFQKGSNPLLYVVCGIIVSASVHVRLPPIPLPPSLSLSLPSLPPSPPFLPPSPPSPPSLPLSSSLPSLPPSPSPLSPSLHPSLSLPVQAGFLETMVMLIIGYLVVVLTVLSISAIATSATVEGGGVYCIHYYLLKYWDGWLHLQFLNVLV